MKNIFKSLMLVAVAAMGIACQEKVEDFTPERANEVVMTITADVEETRTYIDETNKVVKWSAGDQLKVIENSATYRTTNAATIDADGKAQFTVSFPANTSASEFTYNAVYPATAVVEDDAEKIDATKVKVTVNDQQKATATSFDPAADVLVAKQVVTDAQPTSLNMQFKRLVAMGKMSLTGLPADAMIEKVVFTAAEGKGVAGRNYVDATTGEVSQYCYFGKTNVLTVNYSEAISTRDIYFTCNPFELAEGETFKVKAVCGTKAYTREVEIPAGRSLTFAEGDLNTFSVDMTNSTVESVYTFAEGEYAVIAKSGTKYCAMAGVKGSGDFMTYTEVAYDGQATSFTTDDETLVWNIAAVDGGYTFMNHEGKYLSGHTSTSKNNYAYLGEAQTLAITPIDGTNQYEVTIKDVPVRILSYNSSSPRFAFYATDSQVHQLYLVPIVLGDTPGGEEPEEPEGPQAGEAISVEDFLALKDTATEYQLTGKITRVVNESYGNFDLTDETGTVYVYGLLTPDGTAQKQWAAAGLREGDTITIKGKYSVYNSSPQIKNATYVSHIPAPFVEATAVAVDATVTTATISVSANVAWTVTCDAAWVTSYTTSGTNNGTISVTMEANESEEDRVATFTLSADGVNDVVVKLTQKGKPAQGEIAGGSDDFDTISSTNTSYGTGKTTAGWNYKNCAVFKGGTSNSSPAFKMIGDTSNRALCMNGKTSAKGTITSPTLTTGCGTLKFNYGLPFGDTKIKFRVDIMQNSAVVKTFTIDKSSASQYTMYSHEEVIDVAGDFQIVFTNLSPSNNSTSNKDRTAIWDVEWTGYAE
ncbi:MAG: BACON domain-containing protein [Alistipes sp.]|nr:BACON domain-containing protein [Alistipes sp.]